MAANGCLAAAAAALLQIWQTTFREDKKLQSTKTTINDKTNNYVRCKQELLKKSL